MSIIEFFKSILRAYRKNNGYTCDVCKREIFNYPIHRLCKNCEESLDKNNKKTCPKCGRNTVADGVCLDCKIKAPTFDVGVSSFIYRKKTAALVNRIKNGDRRLSLYFGEQTAKKFLEKLPTLKEEFPIREEENSTPLWIIPVPLTKERFLERGYNQADDIAVCVVETLQEEGINAAFMPGIIQRKSGVDTQKRLNYKARLKNAEESYFITDKKRCEGKSVVLVDDIMTTGATGSACAKLLKKARVKTVYFLTVAAVEEQSIIKTDALLKNDSNE